MQDSEALKPVPKILGSFTKKAADTFSHYFPNNEQKREAASKILRIKPNLLENKVVLLADDQKNIDSGVKDDLNTYIRNVAIDEETQRIAPRPDEVLQQSRYREVYLEEEIRKSIIRMQRSRKFIHRGWSSEENIVYERWLYATTVMSLITDTKESSNAKIECVRPIARKLIKEGIEKTIGKQRIDGAWLSTLEGNILYHKRVSDEVLQQDLQTYVDSPPLRQ